MAEYVLAIDQSTQSTKAALFDGAGLLVCKTSLAHRQIINEKGWVSHDPEEIYQNVLASARGVIEASGIDPAHIACLALCNQRETTVVWDRDTGASVCDAIVWQCARAADVCAEIEKTGIGAAVRKRTGIPISPYFPAAKLAWILRNVPEARRLSGRHKLCMGTVDTYLLYKLTGNYLTDFSNASRTQLFDIGALEWDGEICAAFGVDAEDLPRVLDSDGEFGYTDLEGLLPRKIPVRGVMGDSHASLFALGCLEKGMTKASYGTGSSIMMNTGDKRAVSENGLVTSIAWKRGGKLSYVLEGNVNYSAAVISWLRDDLGIISSPAETEALARSANAADTAYLVPAFTGLGMPHWNSGAKALICGMTRLTGKAEIVRAALNGIAYQIYDVLEAMEKDAGMPIDSLRVDGGASSNGYLMQFQSDILACSVQRAQAEELSAAGAAYMAGIASGVCTDAVFSSYSYRAYCPEISDEARQKLLSGWRGALKMVISATKQ